jgi:hypothetical protein
MNVEIGTEAAQFPEEEYKNGIFLADCTKYTAHTGNRHSDIHREYMSRLYTLEIDMQTTHGNRYADLTLGTDIQTTHWEQIYRPHTWNRYADHRVITDIQTTRREQICRPQSEN